MNLWYDSLFVVQTEKIRAVKLAVSGDPGGNRTRDNLIKSQVTQEPIIDNISYTYKQATVPLISGNNHRKPAGLLMSPFGYGTKYAH